MWAQKIGEGRYRLRCLMSDGEPEVRENDLADEEAEEEEPSSDTPSEDPLPTVGEILRQVRTWSVFDLLRLVTSLVHEVQARVVEEERAREDAALATRLGAPWRRAGALARGKGRGKGRGQQAARPSTRQGPY